SAVLFRSSTWGTPRHIPAGQKTIRKVGVPGSIFGRHQLEKWVSFGSAATLDPSFRWDDEQKAVSPG
ncbi:MAG: hypothetical protein KGJ32_03620, partial [Xanthomonadaceae bacterium]|nr:hypothetical protein [Xanthomonadaceae bacterium]